MKYLIMGIPKSALTACKCPFLQLRTESCPAYIKTEKASSVKCPDTFRIDLREAPRASTNKR